MAKRGLKADDWGIKGSLFVGCIIIGSGIGLFTDSVVAWSTVGVGVGFLLVGLIAVLGRR